MSLKLVNSSKFKNVDTNEKYLANMQSMLLGNVGIKYVERFIELRINLVVVFYFQNAGNKLGIKSSRSV